MFRKNVVASIFTVEEITLFFACVISSALKTKTTHSPETSVYNKAAQRHIPEDGILLCVYLGTENQEMLQNITLRLYLSETDVRGNWLRVQPNEPINYATGTGHIPGVLTGIS
jgi:hypothetical protein